MQGGDGGHGEAGGPLRGQSRWVESGFSFYSINQFKKY